MPAQRGTPPGRLAQVESSKTPWGLSAEELGELRQILTKINQKTIKAGALHG